MRVIGIIPARMGSSRFPDKPLAKIHGMPMVGHIYFRSKMAKVLNDVYVATCDNAIYDYVLSIGGKPVMTGAHHERASDRIAEALLAIEKKERRRADIVVMIQGDEPMVKPTMIDAAVKPFLEDKSIKVANLLGRIRSEKEFEDPNCIKVVVDRNNFALYFSREPIPTRKKGAAKFPMYKQICIIPFARDFLLQYTKLEPTPLEKAESIDMLRVLEHGYKVKMVPGNWDTQSVDTPKDLELVERLMKKDELMKKYTR